MLVNVVCKPRRSSDGAPSLPWTFVCCSRKEEGPAFCPTAASGWGVGAPQKVCRDGAGLQGMASLPVASPAGPNGQPSSRWTLQGYKHPSFTTFPGGPGLASSSLLPPTPPNHPSVLTAAPGCVHHWLRLDEYIDSQLDPHWDSFVFPAEHKILCSLREPTRRPCGAGPVGADSGEYSARKAAAY